MNMMPVEVASALVHRAVHATPLEICGFVLQGWVDLPITNTVLEVDKFYMDEGELIEAYRNHGNEIIGIYHSHPRGNRVPSRIDREYAPTETRYWIITPQEVVEWDMSDDIPKEIGRTSANLALAVPADNATVGNRD
jgi:proteasome lid subunit RPN8/RPN11